MNLSLTSFSRKSLRQNGRTFWLASFFLPRKQATKATQLYAFCRLIDNVADDLNYNNQNILLELKEYFHTETHVPETLTATEQELIATIKAADFDTDIIQELLSGLIGDLGETEFVSRRQLLRYAYAVAGTVGILMSKIMQRHKREAEFHAIDLGIAMQLTNIARDILEDAELGRKYIPMRSSIEEIKTKQLNNDVTQNLDIVINLSEVYYQSGLEGLTYLPRKMRPCVYIMAILYRAISRKLKNNGLAWQLGRTVVSPIEKTWLVVRSLPFCLWLMVIPAPRLNTTRTHQGNLHRDLNGLPGTHQ